MIPAETFDALRSRLQARWQPVVDKPEETPDNTLRALWTTAAGTPVSAISATAIELPTLDADALTRLDALLEQRMAGVPLAHLTGRQHFMGLDLLAGPEALIPRKETQLLGEAAIALLREARDAERDAIAIDVCTGSGNLALAFAHHVEGVRVYGADLSESAVSLARRNASLHGLAGRVEFRSGDLLAAFDEPAFHGRVDLLSCNPPYISSGKVETMPDEISGHEPRMAFDGGPLGVSILARLMQEAPRFVRGCGWLAFEVGLGQGPSMARRLRNDPAWDDVRELQDNAGAVRALLARRATDISGVAG